VGDIDFQAMEFAYEKHADQTAADPARHQVVVVGAGPVGLTTALDLARQGVRVVVLDDDYRLSTGSRAICFSKRTLEIWDRLGVGQRMIDKGVSWNVGKIFFREQEVWRFDLLPEPGHADRPSSIFSSITPKAISTSRPASSPTSSCAGRTRLPASCRAMTA